MQKSKFIIGGGISGLVFQYYHPEYEIITPDIGGLFASAYIAIIHDTSETRKFLKDLGFEDLEHRAKKSYIGYYVDGWIRETLSSDLNKLMIQKKMTEWDKKIDRKFEPETLEMSTSKTVNYFKTFDIDPAQVIGRLSQLKRKVRDGKVTNIDDETITYVDRNDAVHILRYDSLVTTIAAPIFWKLYGKPKEFKSIPITNIITSVKPPVFHDKFDSVYYDGEYPFSRITHLTDKYAIEFTGVFPKELFAHEIDNYLVVPHGRIFKASENIPPNEKITFLGRFAQWEYGVVLEHIIKKTLEYA